MFCNFRHSQSAWVFHCTICSVELNSHPSDHVKDIHGISPENNEVKKNLNVTVNENISKIPSENTMNPEKKSEKPKEVNNFEDEIKSTQSSVEPKKKLIELGPKLKCPICNSFFWSDNSLNYHISKVHENEQFNASSKNVETSKNVDAPKNVDITENRENLQLNDQFQLSFKCSKCHISFKSRNGLDNHKCFSCSICNEEFSNIETFKSHVPNCSQKEAISEELNDEPEIITG